jgi:hypothetical protein
MGEYRIKDLLQQDRINVIRERLQQQGKENGETVFLYQAVDGSVFFRSSRMSDERVKELADEALVICRSEIHDQLFYDE